MESPKLLIIAVASVFILLLGLTASLVYMTYAVQAFSRSIETTQKDISEIREAVPQLVNQQIIQTLTKLQEQAAKR